MNGSTERHRRLLTMIQLYHTLYYSFDNESTSDPLISDSDTALCEQCIIILSMHNYEGTTI